MVIKDGCGGLGGVRGVIVDAKHLNAAVDVKSHLEGLVALLVCCVSGPSSCLTVLVWLVWLLALGKSN